MAGRGFADVRIKVGLVAGSKGLPAYARRIAEGIANSQTCSLSLVIENDQGAPHPEGRARKLLEWVLRLDRAISRSTRDPWAVDSRSQQELNVPVIELPGVLTTGPLGEILETDLDLIIDCTDGLPLGDLAHGARLGVWYLGHKRELVPPFVREMIDKEPVTEITIEARFAHGESRVLRRAYARTRRHSVCRNRDEMMWKAADSLVRAVHELGSMDKSDFLSRFEAPSVVSPKTKSESLAISDVLRLAWSVALALLKKRLTEAMFRGRWVVAVRRATPGDGLPVGLSGFRSIEPGPGTSHADPFLLSRGGKHFLFVEEFSEHGGKGHLAVTTLRNFEPASPFQVVLERPYHLSYPNAFLHGDRIVMVPESSANGTIELYEASNFPTEWKLREVLMRGLRAVDATFTWHAEKLWCFVVLDTPGTSSWDELYLFWSDSIEGEWHPHSQNPVRADVRGVRPAGPIFTMDGRLIRPAQNGTITYGHHVVFNQIDTLTEAAFVETPISSLLPVGLRGAQRCHHYSSCDGVEVLDAYVASLRLKLYLQEQWRRWSRVTEARSHLRTADLSRIVGRA